ncbi:MAG: O-antigen ligase family protein [Ktedonobacterales bacterium]
MSSTSGHSLTPTPAVALARFRRPGQALLAAGGAALALALVALAPVHAAWLFAAAALLAAALFAPGVALALVPWAAAFGTGFTLDLHGLHVTPLDALVAGLVLAAAGRVVGERVPGGLAAQFLASRAWLRAAWCRSRVVVTLFAALLLYLAVVVLSLAVATDRVSTLKEIIKWSEVLAVLGAGALLLRRTEQVRVVAWSMIAAGLTEALIGYAQWALSADAAQLAEGGRVFGTFGQPNPYAGYLNLSLPLALALALFARKPAERWWAAAAAAVLLGAEALSASRGGLIGLAAAAVVIAAVGLRRERLAALLIGAGACVLALAAFTRVFPARLAYLVLHPLRLDNVSPDAAVTSANFSTMERLAHWIAGLRMFAAHPLLGVGAGNFNAAYPHYVVNLALWPEALGHAHNYYINVAAETGILGLLAFLAFAAGVVAVAWQATRPAPTAAPGSGGAAIPTRALAIGFFAVVAALLAHNLTDDLFLHGMDAQFALCVACLVSFARHARRDAGEAGTDGSRE